MERYHSMDTTFFDYAAYEQLICTIGTASKENTDVGEDAKEDLTTVSKAFDAFRNYVDTVDIGEVRVKTARFRYEGEDLRAIITTYDKSRRIAHEAAIAQCSVINRIAKFYGVEKIFTGDLDDRLQVADFCLETVCKIFQNRSL